MPNEWGDDPVQVAPSVNEWGDEPARLELPEGYPSIGTLVQEQPSLATRLRESSIVSGIIGKTPRQKAQAELDQASFARDFPAMAEHIEANRAVPQTEATKVALRVAPPLIAGMSGVGLPAAIAYAAGAGGLGEIAAERVEKAEGSRDEFSLPQIGTAALLSGVPGVPLSRIASPFIRGGIRVAEGGLLGASAPVVEAGLQGELANIEDVKESAKYGAMFGAPFGLVEGIQASRALRSARREAKVLERIEGKSLDEQKDIIDQEIKLGEQTDSADTKRKGLELKQQIEAQIEQQRVAEKAQAEQQKAMQRQQAAVAKAQEVPKSTQILQESSSPPPLANVATEVGTQTSPYALQGKLNAMTAVPTSQLDQIAGPPQLPAPELSIEALTGRQRAAAIRRGRDAGPVLDEIVEAPAALPQVEGNSAKANFGRRKALFDANKRAEKEAIELQRVAKEEADDEARWMAEQAKIAQNDGKAIKQTQIKEAVANPETQYQFAVQQGGAGYPGYVQVDAILPSANPGERNTVSSNITDLNKAGAKLPKIPDWVPSKLYTLDEVKALIAQGSPGKAVPRTAESVPVFKTQQDVLDFKQSKIEEEISLYEKQIGLSREEAERLQSLMRRDAGTERFQKSLTPEKSAKVDWFFDESEFNKIDGPVKLWEHDKSFYPEAIGESDSVSDLATGIVQAVGRGKIDFSPYSDKAAYVALAAQAIRDKGGSLTDIAKALDSYTTRHSGSQGDKVEYFKSLGAKVNSILDSLGINIPQGGLGEKASANKPAPALQSGRDNRYDLIKGLSESKLLALSRQLGVDPKGMSGERLRSRVSSNAYEEDIVAALANPAPVQPIPKSRRGSAAQSAIVPLSGGAVGGAAGFAATEQQEGESDEAFQARRLKNTLLSAGAGTLAGVGVLSLGAKQARAKSPRPKSASVDGPAVAGEGQDIRQTAEKIIANKQYPEQLRETLADDPSIVYDKFALNDLGDRVAAATVEELNAMRAGVDKNARVGATIELANRYSVEGKPDEAAALYSEAAQQFTAPAQLINVAKLVRSPQAFVSAINEHLKDVKRALSPKQADELTALAAKTIKAEQELAGAERAAKNDFSDANEAALDKAKETLANARKAVDNYVHQVSPESWGDITSKIIQGNLLTPLSLVANVFGNTVFQPVRRSATSVASALDAIYSGTTGKPRAISRLNPLPSVQELQAAGEGIKIAAKELLTGPSTDSYIKAEVQRGFRPIRSLVQAFTGKNLAVREDGTVALGDRAKKFVEGTLGVAPEVMFRFLNLGDKPFRRAAEMEILMEQAKIKGLKGRDRAQFLEFPDKPTQELIDTEGRRAIFAQENKGVTKLNQFLDSGMAQMLGADKIPALRETIKTFGRIIVPFRQFPVNYVMTALNFAAPELALAKSVYAAQKGDRRKALQHIGEGTLGLMMYGGASYLWENGLISEPTDKDAKQRSVQYESIGPQRINISGLYRALEGGDPTFKLGDTTMDWGRLGIPSSVFYVYTRNAAKDRNRMAKLGQPVSSNYATDRLSAFPGMASFALDQSFLSGTSSFLEAMRNPDPEGQELQNWARNSFRAVTSIAVPNSVEALARAQYEYIPELKGDGLADTLKNTWDYKVMQLPEGDQAILKRDLWGQPIPRTPSGKNAYINQFLDVTRMESKTSDPFKQKLIKLYQETGTPDVYPTLPTRNITMEGVTVKLTPQDYEDYQQLVGESRRILAEKIVNDPRFSSTKTIPEAKILALQDAYSKGAKAGRDMLLRKPGVAERYFPDLMGKPLPSPEESRVVSRDPKARGRLRMKQANEWGDEPAP